MKKSLVTTLTVILLISGNVAIAGDKGGSHAGGNQPAHSNSRNPEPRTSEAAQPKPQPTESVNSGLQLALADAKANYDQALAAAGTDKAAKKAARDAYKLQVKQIKKALGVK